MSASASTADDDSTAANFATYYVQKAGAAYTSGAGTSLPLQCGNKCPAVVGSQPLTRSLSHDAYPVGGGWLFGTGCFDALLSTGCVCSWPHSTSSTKCSEYSNTANHALESAARSCAIDYGYCDTNDAANGGNCCRDECLYGPVASQTAASPSMCSDSPQFVSEVFASLQFTNAADGSEFATAVVMAAPNYRDHATVVQNGVIQVPISPTRNTESNAVRDALSEMIYAGNGSNDTIVYWEQDNMSSCVSGRTVAEATQISSSFAPYTYGSGSGAPMTSTTNATGLSAHDTVYFSNCQLPQQLMPCCTGGTMCCNIGAQATYEYSANNCKTTSGVTGCTNMTVNPRYNTRGIVHRPYRTYFDVLVGKGGAKTTFCDTSSGHDGECVFFNGVVKGLSTDDQSSPLFAYQPNPYRSPGDTNLLRLGVPVSFSLLHSADGTDPATSSYIVQMVNNIEGGSTVVGTNFQYHRGWAAMAAFWDRLSTAFGSSVSSDTYTGFCKAYFMHAVCTRFLLAIYQLAPCCALNLETQMPIQLFCSVTSWSGLVVGTLSLMGGASTFTILSTAKTSTLFTTSQPIMRSIRDVSGTQAISVTLVVPSLLFPWIQDHLGALLLRVFPLTDSATFQLDTTFDPADVFALLIAPPSTDAANSIFTVANVVRNFYYTVSVADPQPQQGIGDSVPPPSTTASAVACSVTFDVLVTTRSMTLLFYLYYLQQVGNVQITTVADFLAATEPAVAFFPKEVGYVAGCALLASGECLRSPALMYSGVGSNSVNALFVSPQSQVCKCLLPTNLTGEEQAIAGSAVSHISNESLCFNVNCAATSTVLVDTPAILLANAASGGTCPAASTTTAIPVSADPTPYDCSQHCSNYLAGLQTGTIDINNVNLVNVVEYCNVDILSAVTTTTPPALLLVSGALALAAMPLLYLVVLCISFASAAAHGRVIANTSSSGQGAGSVQAAFALTLAAHPGFFIPCAIACALSCAAFVYYMKDMRGVQSCLIQAIPDSDGFTYQTSQCRSLGAFARLGIPAYDLPAGMCVAASRFCECDPQSMSMPCRADGCGCDTTDCCSTVGICTQPALHDTPLVGRPLKLHSSTSRFDVATTAICAASAIFLTPAVVAGAVCGARTVPAFAASPWRLAALGLVLALIVLLACTGPVIYRAFTPALCTQLHVGVGACTSLDDYPSTLTLSTDPSVFYTATITTDSAYPVYVRNAAPQCSCDCGEESREAYCASKCSTVDAQCTCAWDPALTECFSSPPPLITYNGTLWQMSFSPGAVPTPVLYNVVGSGIVYQQPSSSPTDGAVAAKPTMFAMFQDDAKSAANTYIFCGQLGGISTCVSPA